MMVNYLIFCAASIAISCAHDISISIQLENLISADIVDFQNEPYDVAAALFMGYLEFFCEPKGELASLRLAHEKLKNYYLPLVNKINADLTGNMVLESVCTSLPHLKVCLKNFEEVIENCFPTKDLDLLNIVYNLIERLADFSCKDGKEKIASFIRDVYSGDQCIQDKKNNLLQCVSSWKSATFTFHSHTLFDEKQSTLLSDLEACVVRELKTCPQRSAADLVQSMFKVVREATPSKDFWKHCKQLCNVKSNGVNVLERCPQQQSPATLGNGATTISVTTATIITAVTTTLLS